jgi:hypothetical protein
VRGVPVDQMTLDAGAPVELAVGLGLGALVALALGQRLAMHWTPRADPRPLAAEAALVSPYRVFGLYVVLLVLGQVLLNYVWVFLSLGQAFVAVSQLRWVPLFVLGYLVFSGREGRGLLLLAVTVEVVMGFGGYFSGFKTVFFVLILAALTARLRLSARQWMAALVLGAAVLALSVVWTGIKEEYRTFLNQGESAQVIHVTWGERMNEVARLITALQAGDLGPALEEGMIRLAYVDYFAEALDYVPASLPHAGGAIWGGALRHVLMPRLFFPEKPVLPSDSELTMQYTGLDMASGAQGTSISLGYVGESYVDFGFAGMWLPVFLMGVLQGTIYAFFVRRTRLRVVGYGFAIATLLPGMLFETTAVKYLGGTLYFLIAFALVAHLFAPRVVRWLIASQQGTVAVRPRVQAAP